METITNIGKTVRQTGFAVVRSVISTQDIELVKQRLAIVAANRDHYEPLGIEFLPEPKLRNPEDHPPLARYARIGHLPFRDLVCWRHLLAHPNLVRLVYAVLRDDFYVNNAGFFAKPARHGAAVPWHQDSCVWGLKSEAWSADDAPLIFAREYCWAHRIGSKRI